MTFVKKSASKVCYVLLALNEGVSTSLKICFPWVEPKEMKRLTILLINGRRKGCKELVLPYICEASLLPLNSYLENGF